MVGGRELVDGGGLVDLPRTEDGRGEVRLVRRVGVVLGLQREPVALPVHPSTRPDESPVEEVPGVELDSGLGREDLENSAAVGLQHTRRADHRRVGGAAPVEHPVVVVTAADHELLEAVADPVSDRGRPGEVHRRAGHRIDCAGRDQRRIHRGVVGRVELQDVIVDRSGSLAFEVPVGVVRQVDDRRLVRRRPVVHPDLVPVREQVDDLGLERARVALVAVRARERQLETDAVAVLDHRGGPDVLVEADGSAVERVRRVVDRQLVGDAVERELAECDPVRVPARDAPEVRASLDVVREVVEAQRDVLEVLAAVRDLHRLDDPAVGEDLDFHAVRVRQGVDVDGLTADGPERLLLDRRRPGLVGVVRRQRARRTRRRRREALPGRRVPFCEAICALRFPPRSRFSPISRRLRPVRADLGSSERR